MRKLVTTVTGAALLATSLLVTGCGSGGGTTAEPPPAAPPASQAAPPRESTGSQDSTGSPAKVPAALRFRGTTLDGKPFSGANLGGKPVVVWFWAPWCTTCMGQAPALTKAAKKYGDRVTFVGIAGLDKSKDQMRQFVSRTGTSKFTHLDDREGTLYKRFKVSLQSTLIFVKPDGGTSEASGHVTDAALNQRIDKMLG